MAVIGLGYIRLPLAAGFAKKFLVVEFDINMSIVDELSSGLDSTLEVDEVMLKKLLKKQSDSVLGLYVSTNPA